MADYSNQKNTFIVYGLGISGIATLKYLSQNFNNKIIACDDNKENLLVEQKKLSQEISKNILFQESNQIEFNNNTIIINSPGIAIHNPCHPILQKALKDGAKIICDIELFYHLNKQQNFIGITGTNGKSTTTALTNEILQHLGIDSKIGGNIGKACFDLKQENKDTSYVFEVSSYQIDLMQQTSFNIAALLNIAPDHLERYGTVENYTNSKKRIFANQKASDFKIINIDNPICYKIYRDLIKENPQNKNIIPISTQEKLKNGLAIINNKIFNNIKGCNFEHKIKPKFLIGKHNKENIAFAYTIAFCNIIKNYPKKLTDLNLSKILAVIENFSGLKHRLEFLGKIDNISFYNDSKATNVVSTSRALAACNDIFLILGGKAKGDDIEQLKPFFSKIQKVYLIGESAAEFAKTLDKNYVKFEMCNILEKATKKAFIDAKNCSLSQKTILLSPACASFDQWQNFEQRGNHFCTIFNELAKKNQS